MFTVHRCRKIDVTVSHLGERLFLDSGTLTRLLKRMDAAGLLGRARSGVDERRVQIALTAAGHALKAQAAKVPACVISATHLPVAARVSLVP